MGEQEEVIAALERYFDKANPDDDNLNNRLIQDDLQRYGTKLILMAPAVIIVRLDRLVSHQRLRAMYVPEEVLNFQLMGIGFGLLMKYASLIKAAGPFGILSLAVILPTMLKQDEDLVTIIAYTLGTLVRSDSRLIANFAAGATSKFQEFFQQAFNTGTKIALAYALFEHGERTLFESYALTHLVSPKEKDMLKKMLAPGDTWLSKFIAGALVMDIASNGRAVAPELGWQRRTRKY